LGAAAGVAAILLGACAPRAITKTGREVEGLYNIVLVMATIVFVAVELAIIWQVVKYRRRRNQRVEQEGLPPQIHGNRMIEIVWTAIPSVIVTVLFVMSIIVLYRVNNQTLDEKNASDPVDLVVNVNGFQWQWGFTYADPTGKDLGVNITGTGEQIPTVVVPVSERIHFNLTSQDVIHSFFVPAFLFKRDLIPGHPNAFEVTIDPDRTGMYVGECAEFCGDFHNAMLFNMRAVTPAEFDTWLAQEQKKQAKGPTCSPQGTEVDETAKNIAFEEDCLAAPANQSFTIKFTNDDAGTPHNIAIFTDESAKKNLFTGDIVTGVTTTTYSVSSLKPGTYFFRCDVHPDQMTGTFIVK
jgi:cytochrome c oxidase subunit 2